MTHTEQLSPAAAQSAIAEGSDIVIIPYASYQTADNDIRLTVFTEMTAQAGAELYHAAATGDTMIVAVGEHTYGEDNTSTTELIYTHMANQGVSHTAFATEHPRQANATPQQVDWLQRTYGERWQTHTPVLVGHAQHWERIAFLCRLYRLPALFVDASQVLESAGKLTAVYREAAALYDAENRTYEDRVGRLTKLISVLGPSATTTTFRMLAHLRSPNVVDVDRTGEHPRLYAVPVRRHRRNISEGSMT